MPASTSTPAPIPAAVEQLVMKLYSPEPLTHQERCSLAALLDVVAAASRWDDPDVTLRAGMWMTVSATYWRQVDQLTTNPEEVSR